MPAFHAMCRVYILMLVLMFWVPARSQSHQHTEARHVFPITISPDGQRLFALNSADARLSVFELSSPTQPLPVLVAEIPVGLEPVSVRMRTSDEIWVVNELSDSISIISLSRGAVIASLHVPDEPADVAFAMGRAFVTCARNNLVRVFNEETREPIAVIPLAGIYPRTLTVHPAGDRIYVGFQLSGNRTTILPATQAPPQPPPANTALPAPPRTALIVPSNDPRIPFTVQDVDVVEINASTLQPVRTFSDVGNNLFGMAFTPDGSKLWVANTEALNLIAFEPNLRGRFLRNRLTQIDMVTGHTIAHDLNPGVDYDLLPNPVAASNALAQPKSLEWDAMRGQWWVAAFGSDRISAVSETGDVLLHVDIRTNIPHGEIGTRAMRGPRGMALHPTQPWLYVLNKLSCTISVIHRRDGTVIGEVPAGSFDPTPIAIREGRGFLFDARLSGNGMTSCASCHIDADRDGIAWDLGDPFGNMLTVLGANLSVHDTTPRPRTMHPMKGPMVTQSLRGISQQEPFHWRGDRATFAEFNPTFDQLMGGNQIAPEDMDAFEEYLATLVHHPNPFRNADRTMPTTLMEGSPARGLGLYFKHDNHCIVCHILPSGTDLNIDLPQEVGSNQPLKNPTLRTVYQRIFFNPRPGQSSPTGFGMLHDGTGFSLPIVHPYILHELATVQDFKDVTAYVMAFDTGTAPAVGMSRTATLTNRSSPELLSALLTLENTAAKTPVPDCDLVVRGRYEGVWRSFLYIPGLGTYKPDHPMETSLSRSALLDGLQDGDAITFMGVFPGQGTRLGGDRNRNGQLDAGELAPRLHISPRPHDQHLFWSSTHPGWIVERSTSLTPNAPWQSITHPAKLVLPNNVEAADQPQGTLHFYRLRRTW